MNPFSVQTRAYLVPSCHSGLSSVRFCASRASVAVTVSRCGQREQCDPSPLVWSQHQAVSRAASEQYSESSAPVSLDFCVVRQQDFLRGVQYKLSRSELNIKTQQFARKIWIVYSISDTLQDSVLLNNVQFWSVLTCRIDITFSISLQLPNYWWHSKASLLTSVSEFGDTLGQSSGVASFT